MINDYLSLSTRAGFNKSLAHFRMVTDIVKRMGQGENLAEIIDALEKGKGVEKSQIGPILNAIVIDRMQFGTRSFNLPHAVTEFGPLCAELQQWNRLDLLIAYHHPQLGISLLNPKQSAHWEAIRELSGDELVVIYAHAFDAADKPLEHDAVVALHDLLLGRKVNGTSRFGGAAPKARPAPAPAAAPRATPSAPPPPPRPAAATPVGSMPMPPPPPPSAPAAGNGGETPEAAPAPAAAAPSGGKMKMTPKYSVQVSNELFHNGNVEAWKNIVESYKTKYPGLEVHIFHDGQKVNNINALFKWGKVKHGDVIVFCVSGDEFKGVAKLQRYLYEGASIRFENFLKKDVNKVLNLF